MRITHRRQLEARCGQQTLNPPAQLQAMLQGARCMPRQRRRLASPRTQAASQRVDLGDHLLYHAGIPLKLLQTIGNLAND